MTHEYLETFEDVKTPKVKNSDIKIHQVSAKVESEQLSGPHGTLQQRSSTPTHTLSASKVAVQPAQGERYNLQGVQTNASQLMHHIKCHLCEKPHASISCHIFKNAMQRQDRVTELRLCFNCLRHGHTVQQCQSRNCYKVCGQRHHTALCRNNQTSLNKASSYNANSNGSNFNRQGNQPSKNPAINITSSHIKSDDIAPSVLPTVTLHLKTAEGKRAVRAMFDSGSQRSFISAELAHKYKLKKLKSVPVVLSTFGNEAKSSKRNLVEATTQH